MGTMTTTLDLGGRETGLEHGCGGGCAGGSDGCGCGGGCATCWSVAERPRWFAGQLVTPGDLEALQQWVLGRSRRHNRLVHGWGVACGLAVNATTSPVTGETVPWSVTVGSGYALSGCGDEVCVPTTVTIDVRQPRPEGSDGCAPPTDPWCAPVRERREPEQTYYLAVSYDEQPTRPVRSSGCGCGCEDDPCEYSRVRETYALAILDKLPDCYTTDAGPYLGNVRGAASSALGEIQESLTCSPGIRELGTRPCPDCCSTWVVLADLQVDAAGTLTVDPLAHRRFIASFGSFAFSCPSGVQASGSETFNRAELSVLKGAFATALADEIETADAATIGAQPALQIRGAGRSKAFRDLVGGRTVAELAKSDLGALTAAGRAAGVDPEDVDHLYSVAVMVTKMAGQ